MTSSPLYMTSHPLYLNSRPLYLCHHTHSIDDITANICMIGHLVYVWDPIHYIYGIILSMCDIITLCVDDTTLGIYMRSLNFRWRHIHSIKTNHTIHDVTSTSGMTSHPFYQTLNPLYLCHHNLCTDITATFVWHHTHYLCDIICTVSNITSTAYVITLLCLWQHNIYMWNHIQYAGPHIPYTCDITATNLCHHTNCIDNITPTLCMASHFAYV